MRKYLIFIILLPAVILFTSCNIPADNINPKVTKAPERPEFTQGVWLKKYPEDNACFKLETSDGYQIVCDPYHIDETLQPDIVTESHQDADHTQTYLLETPYELIKEPIEYKSDHVVIHGYVGKHNKGDKDGTNIIYVFELGDITIAHFASQGEVPSDELLKKIGAVDVLMIQVFDNPSYHKLTVNDTDTIVNQLKPKIIIPEHGDSNADELLTKHFNATEDVEDSGCVIITRQMIDEVDGILIINLDNY